MLKPGEFDRSVDESGIEIWVTQMGGYMNMNTAFIDRENEIVAIIDPFDSGRWVEALEEEGLYPTHLLYTHTHRDHAAGYPQMKRLVPNLEVWGHIECNQPGLLSHVVFRKIEFTNLWDHAPQTEDIWKRGAFGDKLVERLAPWSCRCSGRSRTAPWCSSAVSGAARTQ